MRIAGIVCAAGAALALVAASSAPGVAAAAAQDQGRGQGQGQGQDQPQGQGRGRGRGAITGGVALPPGARGGRGGRGAAAPLDPGGVQRQRIDLDTVILTDAKGMVLYTFAKDTPGQSACAGQCAANWPPLVAAADAEPSGDWTIITRADGTRQWAHQGRPLYAFVKDAKPGERSGDGLAGGAWKVASPFVPYVPAKK
jgi:predicted lipoprotein with Yx(FWY)xxD motif